MSSNRLFLIISFLLCLSTIKAHGHYANYECKHDEQEFSPSFIEVDEEFPEPEGRALGGAPNLRIYPYYDLLTGGNSEFRSYIRYDLIPPVLDYFEATLKIRHPLRGALKVDSSVSIMCESKTPSILQTSGVNADHFMFFTIESGGGNFLATSKYCHLAAGTNRPVVSRVKFTTKGLELPRGDVLLHESNTYVLMHELMHSFGFSDGLFPYFLDDSGNPRQNHIKKVSLHGKTRTVLDLPSLTSRIRRHFGCSSLPGAYLENNGDAQLTAGSHFERKHFLLDLMTSGMLHGRRVSEFSLAVLEGSGWYSINYNSAEPYHYGVGQGCGFINNKCGSKAEFDEFCTTSERGCFSSGRGGGKCKSDPNADGCKYHSPSLFFDCHNPDAKDQARLPELQVFGREAGSKCFEGTLSNAKNDQQSTFCFRYDCLGSGSGSQIAIQVGNHRVVCKQAGNIEVEGYEGTIKCPDPLTYCRTMGKNYCPRNCMGRGSCVNNECRCTQGRGIDCGLRV